MIEEDLFGNRKKLDFIISSMAEYTKSKNLDSTAIKILDLGCGNGTAVAFPLASQGYNVVGVDMHQSSIDYARSKCNIPNLLFECKDIEKVLLKDRFDSIICKDILEHLYNPNSILNNIHRGLKDDGILIISIPNGYGPFEIERYVTTKSGLQKIANYSIKGLRRIFSENRSPEEEAIPYNLASRHVQFFTLKDFIRLMSDANFEITKVMKVSFMGSDFSGIILGRSKKFIQWNISIANMLPYWAVSTWCFVAKKSI